MTNLNLTELARLEREGCARLTFGNPTPWILSAQLKEIEFITDQLQPLLDLVDRLGVAGRELADHVHYDYDANCSVADQMLTVLADYKRAKENK